MHLKIDWKWFSQKTFGDYCYVFHRKRIHWYSDCKRISKQEVELPMHKSDSYEVSSHGHYRPQERQRRTRDRADRRKNWLKLNSFSLYQSQDDKSGTHNSQHQAARIIGVSLEIGTAHAERRGLHPFKRMRTSAVNISWLTKPSNFSQIFCHFLFGNSFAIRVPVHPFLVKHIKITAKSSFAKTIFSLLFKCVIYIIRFLTRITSSRGIQWRH